MSIKTVQNGRSEAEVKKTIKDILDYGLGLGQGDGLNWLSATNKLNTLANEYGVANLYNRQPGTEAEFIINSLIRETYLPEGFDLYVDFELGKMWNNDQVVNINNDITDLWSGGPLPDKSGNYQNFAPNVLARPNSGLWTQPQRTNNIGQSNFASGWVVNSGAVRTPNFAVAPDGSMTVTRIQSTGVNSGVYRSGITVTAGVACTFSFFARNNGVDPIIEFGLGGSVPLGVAGDRKARLNLNTGEISNVDPIFTRVISYRVGEYFRFECTVVPVATGTVTPLVYGRTSENDFLIWAGQLEDGAFASQPMIAVGSIVTRTANRQTISLAGRLQYGVAGFIKADIRQPGDNSSGIGSRIFEFNDGNTSNLNRLFMQGNSAQSLSIGGNVGGLTLNGPSRSSDWTQGLTTIAFAAVGGLWVFRRVGSIQTTLAQPLYPTAMDRLSILGRAVNPQGNTYGVSKKLGLIFGTPEKPINQALFDQVFAQAEIEAINKPEIL